MILTYIYFSTKALHLLARIITNMSKEFERKRTKRRKVLDEKKDIKKDDWTHVASRDTDLVGGVAIS